MFKDILKDALTFDDIQIVPKFSDIKHRSFCNIETRISKRYTIKSPIVSAPMDTVTEWQMAKKMWELGGVGFIHRFMPIEDQCEQVRKTKDYNAGRALVGAAIGVTKGYDTRAEALVNAGVRVLLIDVAHGYHLLVQEALSKLKSVLYTEDHRRVCRQYFYSSCSCS